MAKTVSVKSLIKDLEPNELREVIVELCKLSKKNRQFIELYLSGSEGANPDKVLKEGMQKIYQYFHGRRIEFRLDLRGARNTVTEYGKLLKEYPQQAAELKLYYVEVGTVFTFEFGDMYEGFYQSLVSMLDGFFKDIRKHPEWYPHFVDRINQLLEIAGNIGWGYGYEVEYQVEDLRRDLDQQ